MNITVNGNNQTVEQGITLAGYLDEKQIIRERTVIELNKEIIKKDRYDSLLLKNNDTLEIISFVGGG